MATVTVFDTSIASENLGDELIMRSVDDVVTDIFSKPRLFRIPTHDRIGKTSYNIVEKSEHLILGGTNLLSSNLGRDNQWKISPRDAFHITDTVLLGVGWKQYQQSPSTYTKMLLNRLLSDDCLHSVRDEYTKEMLESAGVRNVINTGCPTLWEMDTDHCRNIPEKKAANVVFTLTKYNKDAQKDKQIVDILRDEYKELFFWPQGFGDLEYLESLLDTSDINILPPRVREYSNLLSSQEDLDYVGTRLHGGIHSLSHHQRSIILSIDNRAAEMGDDFCLPIVKRDRPEKLRRKIQGDLDVELELPAGRIKKWKDQFNSNGV